MINDLKLGFKLMKYGHSAKLSIIGSIVLAVFGLVFCAVGIKVRQALPGGYFLMLSVLLLLQLISTVNAANLVQTSPMKKKLQISVPALFSVLLMLAAYLLNVVVAAVALFHANPESLELFCSQIMYTAVMMGIIMLYYGAVFKYFVASTVVFFIMFVLAYPFVISGMLQWSFMPFAEPWENFALTAVTGLAVILVCGVLQYLISLAVYKAPISKRALGARLRSQL